MRLLIEDQSKNAFINYNRDTLDYAMDRISRFALTKTDGQRFLKTIVEKPTASETSDYKDEDGKYRVRMNIFKFDGSKFYAYLKNCPLHQERSEKELPTVIVLMIKDHPQTMRGIPLSEHVPDLTGKNDIHKMETYLITEFKSMDWRL